MLKPINDVIYQYYGTKKVQQWRRKQRLILGAQMKIRQLLTIKQSELQRVTHKHTWVNNQVSELIFL
uniref:Uncharacterized protein n=1 Tax=Arundo donax TaxID=35708 RepID=A0A0A9HA28_ARUDO